MYHVTVTKNGNDIVRGKVYDDYAEAIAFISQYYQPRAQRSVLSFTTEVINGQFARSFAALTKPEDIEPAQPSSKARYQAAAKQDNAFRYDASYFFLIESEVGIGDGQAMQAAFEQEE